MKGLKPHVHSIIIDCYKNGLDVNEIREIISDNFWTNKEISKFLAMQELTISREEVSYLVIPSRINFLIDIRIS